MTSYLLIACQSRGISISVTVHPRDLSERSNLAKTGMAARLLWFTVTLGWSYLPNVTRLKIVSNESKKIVST